MTFEQLKNQIEQSGRQYDLAVIEKAYLLAEQRHRGQKRRTGDPYIIHPLNVASLLVELGLDTESVAAALLHDVVEDTPTELSEIEKGFGSSIALLVDGVTKLGKIPFSSTEELQAENLRKMLLAMSRDIRVMLIKLCDRVHNMRTLSAMAPQKQRDVALETMEVYAPIAHRLGMNTIKEELEDLSLKYLDPMGYEEIVRTLKEDNLGESFINGIISSISKRMQEAGIKVESITGRVKSVYGIYRKLYIQNKAMKEIFDIYAVRVILSTTADCYNALGVLHDMYRPIPSRFKDYISTPKPNGYRSLHTSVIGNDAMPFEIQIRTLEMHNEAEYGVAAHWKYKAGISGRDLLEERLAWVRQLLESQQESDDSVDILRDIKSDLIPEEIFVFTPKGDVINLPYGSTVIDFAYAIHSAVGNRMIGAKVNNRIVPLTYRVKTGEIIEVITGAKDKGPSRDWLNIVQTSQAKSKIRAWFKKERREENIVEGRSMFEKELRRQSVSIPEELFGEVMEELVRRQKLNSEEELFASLGYGGVQMSRLVPKLKDILQRVQKPQEPQNAIPEEMDLPAVRKRSKGSDGVIVEGLDNCLVKFARCCNPLPGDDIVGFITRGQGVTVHKRDCMNVAAAQYLEDDNAPRWIKVEWDSDIKETFHATLEVEGLDRIGFVADVSGQLANLRIPIYAMRCRTNSGGKAVVDLTIGITNKEHLDTVVSRLKKIKDVTSVDRLFK